MTSDSLILIIIQMNAYKDTQEAKFIHKANYIHVYVNVCMNIYLRIIYIDIYLFFSTVVMFYKISVNTE